MRAAIRSMAGHKRLGLTPAVCKTRGAAPQLSWLNAASKCTAPSQS